MSSLRVMSATLLLSLSAGACYGTDRPHTADTNTNWLYTCKSSSDCGGDLVCAAGVCTIACEQSNACDVLPSGAQCVTGFCDMRCGNDGACASLGGDFTCREQRCRQAPVVVGMSDAGQVVDASTPLATFDDEGRITLSNVYRQASQPKVAWNGERWIVAWRSMSIDWAEGTGEPLYGTEGVDVVELSDVGTAARYRVEVGTQTQNVTGVIGLDEQRHQLVALEPRNGEKCDLHFVSWLAADVDVLGVPCTDSTVSTSNIDGGDQWIVVAADGSDIVAGRYSSLTGWTAPLATIAERDDARALTVTSSGDVATVVWGSKDAGTSALVMDAEQTPSSSGIAMRFAAPTVHNRYSYAVAQLPDRAIVLTVYDDRLWSSVLADDPEPAVIQVAETDISDIRPGVAVMPEHDLIAVCYATGAGDDVGAHEPIDGVSVILLDLDGNPISDPVEIAWDMKDTGGCDLAWSGSELLIAWQVYGAPPYSNVVRALRLPAPW